jgi:hypothetical protein
MMNRIIDLEDGDMKFDAVLHDKEMKTRVKLDANNPNLSRKPMGVK